jgi:type IV pilus assembly protein PilV
MNALHPVAAQAAFPSPCARTRSVRANAEPCAVTARWAKPHRLRKARGQQGVMLLEVLIALLIFSIGALGLVGLQAAATRQSNQASFRAEAALLAQDLVGQMWLGARDHATLNAAYSSSATTPAGYNAWKDRVKARLPGIVEADIPNNVAAANLPTVELTQQGAGANASTRVTITLFWKAPGEPPADPSHQYRLVTEIR